MGVAVIDWRDNNGTTTCGSVRGGTSNRSGISGSRRSWTSCGQTRPYDEAATACTSPASSPGNGDISLAPGQHGAGALWRPKALVGKAASKISTSSRRSTGCSAYFNAKPLNLMVKMSVGAEITSLDLTDPMTLAVKRVVDAGVVVVAAAGNRRHARRRGTRSGARLARRAMRRGSHRGCVEHEGHARARRRRHGELQLARTHLHRLGREARPGGAGRRLGVAPGPGQHAPPSPSRRQVLLGHGRLHRNI